MTIGTVKNGASGQQSYAPSVDGDNPVQKMSSPVQNTPTQTIQRPASPVTSERAAGQPELPEPKPNSAARLHTWGGIPSPGMLFLMLMLEFASEQRQVNMEVNIEQMNAVFDSMMKEAGEMRTMAMAQAVLGALSAGMTIIGGLHQAKVAGTTTGLSKDELGSLGEKAHGIGTAWSGLGKGFDAGQQYTGATFQASLKELQADQEKMRTYREHTKEFSNAFKELINRSLSSMDSLQSSKNQATQKILA